MLNGDVNNTWKRAANWILSPTNARVIGDDYTNNTNNPVLVIASIRLRPRFDAAANGDARARLLDDPAGSATLIGTIHADEPPTGVTPDHIYEMYHIVNPGETMDIQNAGGAASLAPLVEEWDEFQWNGKHTPQTWVHAETGATAKLNAYLSRANRVLQAGGDPVYLSEAVVVGTAESVVDDNVTFVVGDFQVGAVANDGSFSVERADSGGALAVVGEVGHEGLNGVYRLPMALFVNGAGQYEVDDIQGAVANATLSELTFVKSAAVSDFATGDSGAATEQKFTDLDNNAALGVNVSKAFTRAAGGAGGGAEIVNADRWGLVVASVLLAPTVGAAATAQVNVGGITRLTLEAPAAGTAITVMVLLVVPRNVQYSFTLTNAAVEGTKYEWTVQS